jgi:hypothetical protein
VFSFYANKSATVLQFFSVIAGVSALAVSVNLIIDTYVKSREVNDRNMDTTVKVSNEWIDMYKLFIENYPYSHKLMREMSFAALDEYKPPKSSREDPIEFKFKQQTVDFYLCMKAIQIIENFLVYGKYDTGADYKWISTYLWWFYSDTLRQWWTDQKLGYSSDTVEFCDSLMAVSADMKKNEPTNLQELRRFVKRVKYTFR